MNKRAKIAGRLKALFPKANLSTKKIDVITAKLESKVSDDADDAAIDEIVNQANDFMDFEALAKEDDRVRTLEANQKKGEEGKGEGTDPDKTLEPPKDDTPEWAKTLLNKVEALEKGEISKSKANTVADLFSKSEILKGLPENQKQSWLKRVNLESEDLAAEVAALETEYTELRQSIVDSVDYAGGWSSEEVFANQLPNFFITSPDFEKADFACNLIGQSISRRIPHRAVIGLRQINDWELYFPTNEVYAVLMKNELRTVKIVKRSEKEGYLTLIPDPLPEYNQTIYEPEEVPIHFVAKMFQIVAWAQFERVAM